MLINKNLSYDLNQAQNVFPIIQKFFNPDNTALTAYLLNTVKAYHVRLSEVEKAYEDLKQSQLN